ncbi:hypothetical protein Celal_3753 [Cellulophaga algicola DSM 14237]|uniref:Uncharacterized protein n=1 Tax=Cellulophaga algicola (strain DSM 14237 / IC166 / ACAM 630) TaxID=688270 RepID=E6XAP0_CELAD|nr:hypothetical protein [Cellulophaga algicola]ADV51002.1 hypothetical protein Celal_3753 [Cellulophaga algicola DSM 14237]
MSNLEQAKRRLKLKRILRKDNTTATSIDNDEAKALRNKVANGLNKSLKKQEFKLKQNSNPSNPWRTDRYNRLDGYTGHGIDKSKKNKLNSNLDNTGSWWTKPIDVSFKNPWPEARWDWFDRIQSGDYVYGPKRNGNEGRHRGVNGKIYTSYQGDEVAGWWNGGGTSLKSWAHELNLLNQIIKGVQTTTGTIERVDKITKMHKNKNHNSRIINKEIARDSIFNSSTDNGQLLETQDSIIRDTIFRVQYWKDNTPYGGPAYDPHGMNAVKFEINLAKELYPELDSVSVKLVKIQ